MDKGIRKVICTDISCDGMLSGPSIDLYKEMLAKFPDLYLMASGGVVRWMILLLWMKLVFPELFSVRHYTKDISP